MTEDDKDALKEFLQGAGMVIFTVGSFLLGVFLIGWLSDPPSHEQSTEVVGTYKGCDIIQWNYGALSEYKYFLYCEKNK
jgi:hypothetical protein